MIFTLVTILALGTFILHHLSKLFNVPFTVIMFVIGLLLGALVYPLPWLDDYLTLLYHIPPRLLFHIFLPILIFEGSFGMKTHAFRQVFEQSIILAGPGLMLNTIIIGVALKFIIPSWNWYMLWLIGSVLSATDPVAVVALLKGLGVDKRITALIDGEAILNDGTAIIAYTLCLPAAAVGFLQGSWAEITVQSLVLIFGGVVVGLTAGWLQVACLNRTSNDLIRTCITICGAYISYYIADVWVGTSGVITLCFEGVYLAANFPGMFPGAGGSSFTHVWEFMVHGANTALFAMVGIIMAKDAIPNMTAFDLFSILYLYAAVILGRFAMIYILRYPLNYYSYKLGHAEIIMLVHGGLRGGVATALALAVVQSGVIPKPIALQILVLVTGVVFLTLTVNATTADWMVTKVGLRVKDSNRLTQMKLGRAKVIQEGQRAIRKIQANPFVPTTNWAMLGPILESVHDPYGDMYEKKEAEDEHFHNLLMRHFKTSVWKQYDARQIEHNAARLLTRIAADCIRNGDLITTIHLQRLMKYPWSAEVYDKLKLYKYGGEVRSAHDRAVFGVLVAFSRALDEVESGMFFYIRTKKELEEAHLWLTTEREAIREKTTNYAAEKPRTARSVITAMASELMLSACESTVKELHDRHGFALPGTASLLGAVDAARGEIWKLPRLVEAPTPVDIWRLGILSHVPEPLIKDLAQLAKARDYATGQEIALHPNGPEIAVVAFGAVSALGRQDVTFGCGYIFGLPRCFTQRRRIPKFHALMPTKLLAVPWADLKALVDISPTLFDVLIHGAGTEVAERLLSKRSEYRHWGYDRLKETAKRGRVVRIPTEGYIYPRAAGEIVLFLKGKSTSGLITHETEPTLIPESAQIQWTEGTHLFVLTPGLDISSNPERAVLEIAMSNATTVPTQADLTLEELSVILSGSVRQAAAIQYDEAKCATPSQLFNQLQLDFLLEVESLSTIGREYNKFHSNTSRLALVEAISHALAFLSTFCLQYFAAEIKIYEEGNAPAALLAAHRSEHEELLRSVSEWLELKYLDALCHDAIIKGMRQFAETHFEKDAESLRKFRHVMTPLNSATKPFDY